MFLIKRTILRNSIFKVKGNIIPLKYQKDPENEEEDYLLPYI
ncbi:hypothetical protein HJ01_00711 [Flavobacterium frigoris PS1]|uniref:Uncharacterized protein n=1 Tax=Flavobacterium frigoris (strain PS1) TaxID=1086011 RepID=H7FNP0_FLAFP|nr:hypothetical protein HJ01_00711 [Flavobacterium frigoris PS1]